MVPGVFPLYSSPLRRTEISKAASASPSAMNFAAASSTELLPVIGTIPRVGFLPISSLSSNSILVTGISPSMLKASLIGSKVSSGTSTTEELLSEEVSLSETDSLEEEEGGTGATLELGLELATLLELGLEELAELEEELLEELLSEELLEEPVISVTPSFFHTAVKETSLLGA